ncbi:MAG: L,D-transpeptidase family protein [Thermodesulfobacteriota bacterium]
MSKDYRKSYRIFLILFLFSFGTNLFMLTLLLKERIGLPSSSPPIPISSLPPKEVKVAQELKGAEGKKGVEEPRGVEESKAGQETKVPQKMVPLPFIHVKAKDYFLLCEKHTKTLHLYRSEENAFLLVKTYPCIVGSNNVDKKEAGDLATPEGIYFLTSFLTGKSLPEKYGSGAFALNYPNFLDRKEGKKGSGIWLHGCPEHLERPPFSEGCVVVKNAILKELVGFIKIGDTPLVIVDTIKSQPQEDQRRFFQNLSSFLNDWEMAWESRDTDKYLSFYSKDFVSSDGKNYQRFKDYKHRVNHFKRFIQLQIEKKAFLLSQKDGGQIAILRINQDYHSDNFKSYSRKILYLREEQGKWKIIGEIPL